MYFCYIVNVRDVLLLYSQCTWCTSVGFQRRQLLFNLGCDVCPLQAASSPDGDGAVPVLPSAGPRRGEPGRCRDQPTACLQNQWECGSRSITLESEYRGPSLNMLKGHFLERTPLYKGHIFHCFLPVLCVKLCLPNGHLSNHATKDRLCLAEGVSLLEGTTVQL